MDFYSKNARFSGLIRHYARKGKDPEIEAELWAFLYELSLKNPTLENERYTAVCLRNRFFTLCNRRKKQETIPLAEAEICAPQIDHDLRIDLAEKIARLTPSERGAIKGHFYEGKSFEQIAKETEKTRQAVRQNCARGILRLRDFYGDTERKD